MKTGNNKKYPILRVSIWSKYDDLSRSSWFCCYNTQRIKYFTISCNSSSSNSSVQSVTVSATWNMVLLSAQLFLISLLNFFYMKISFFIQECYKWDSWSWCWASSVLFTASSSTVESGTVESSPDSLIHGAILILSVMKTFWRLKMWRWSGTLSYELWGPTELLRSRLYLIGKCDKCKVKSWMP